MALPAPTRAFAPVVALVLVLGAGCTRAKPGHEGCSKEAEAEVAAIAELPILYARPPATQDGGAFSGCGTDDSGDPIEPHAGRRYRSTLSEPQIRSFYWAELAKDGWYNASTAIPSQVPPSLAFQRGVSCLVKAFHGTQLRFDIHFDATPGPSAASPAPSAYAIQAVATPGQAGDNSC
jgi:hypothetical protein